MKPDRDPAPLHQEFRARLLDLEAALARERIPLRLYEAARHPMRQALLYARGRVAGHGPVGRKFLVTGAQAWESEHQGGWAADYVFFTPGTGWTWTEPEPGAWARYVVLAHDAGLEHATDLGLRETPHVQMPGYRMRNVLDTGEWPQGGGEAWRTRVTGWIDEWGGRARLAHGQHHPGAPIQPPGPLLSYEDERPPLVA